MKKILLYILLFSIAVVTAKITYAADRYDIYWKWKGEKNPVIGIGYGYGSLNDKNFTDKFSDTGQFDVKLGYAREFLNDRLWIDESFIFCSYMKNDFYKKSMPDSAVNSGIKTIGIGTREGFANNFMSVYLYPYNENTFSWSKTEFSSPFGLSFKDSGLLKRYEDSFRFGYSGETGLAIGVLNGLEIRTGYNYSIINPRVEFWEFAGSHILEQIGYSVISSFAFNIVDVSPVFGPVIYAVLRGAYMYAFNYMRKDGMDWPFSSEKPLTIETFKFGITFKF